MKTSTKKTFLPRIALLMVLLVTGCGGAGRAPAVSTQTPTAAAAGAAETAAAAQPLESFPWLRIALPAGWQETAEGRYEGADGYAWLELRDSQGAGRDALCMGEANRGKPERYGAYPEIRDLMLGEQPACLILPSADQPAGRTGEALYLLPLPESIRKDSVLALHGDKEHIPSIIESLGFAQPVVVETSMPCDFSIAGSPAQTTREGGLRIDEFPIAQGPGCSPYNEAQNFSERAQSGPAGTRAGEIVFGQWQSERLNRLNAKLSPFGYKVENEERVFRLLRGGQVARTNISWLGQVSVRTDGQDFYFPILDGYNATAYLVDPNGVHPLEDVDLLIFDQVFPVYSGKYRIAMKYDYERIPRPIGSPALLNITRNERLIDTISVSGANPAKGPARGLWSWQDAEGTDHWVLDLPGLVIQDGEMLHDRLGYAEMFSWRLLKEKPFYFYRKDGQIRAVYDGQRLPVEYEEVIAEPQYSDRILIQMKAYESGLAFFAKKSGIWHLVVLEAE